MFWTREIRNQVFDEKKNTVTITVICCSPEKFREKLCCKGGKAIKSIEIKEPVKKKPDPVPDPELATTPPAATQPEPATTTPAATLPELVPEPVNGNSPVYPLAYPVATCCGQCYEGYGGGPCHHGYGRPVRPPPGPCYDGCWYAYGYGYSGNRSCCANPCVCIIVENPSGCSTM